MEKREYLRKYLGNLIASGAIADALPGEDIWLIAMTQWRWSDPWHPGQWVAKNLREADRFRPLLAGYWSHADLEWLRIDRRVLDYEAEALFGRDVYDRVQDLFDLIDTEWRRTHRVSDSETPQVNQALVARLRQCATGQDGVRPSGARELVALIDHCTTVRTDVHPLVQAEAAGWVAYVAGRPAAPAADPVVMQLVGGMPVGGGATHIFRAFQRGRDGAAAAAAQALAPSRDYAQVVADTYNRNQRL